jgi:hypothetical protein
MHRSLRRIPLRIVLGAAATLGAAGCDSILETNNPNNVNVESLAEPASATPQVNGVIAAITRGATQVLGHISTTSDELSWSGSLDGMDRLNRGFIADPFNEFLTDATTGMTPARYTANQTIKNLEAFRAAQRLSDPVQLGLANLYAAVTYLYIANHFDDFVIESDRQEGSASVGPAKMVVLFDSVDAAATRALAIIPASSATLRGQILAVRARGKFDRAIWQKLNPSGKVPAQPLVDVQGAADDATAALPLLGADARFRLEVQNLMSFGNCFLPNCTNSRREVRFDPRLGTYNYTTRVLTVALRDPISNQPDPALAALMTEFVVGPNNNNLLSPVNVTGSRDMRLIIAEVALARGNLAEFTTQINAIRALNQLPAWTGVAPQPSARDILIHERRVNLFLQGRRLNDMYRFGIVDTEWSPQSDAATCPGALIPIVDIEIQTNPKVASAQPACGQ